jgi:hypothetical protein
MMRHHRTRTVATRVGLAVAVAATAAPASAVAISPDAHEANQVVRATRESAFQSPDARALNRDAKERAQRSISLVTPDAQDAGDPRRIVLPPRPKIVVQRVSPSGGMDWGDAALGAAGALGLVLVASGGGLLVTRRHGGHVRAA